MTKWQKFIANERGFWLQQFKNTVVLCGWDCILGEMIAEDRIIIMRPTKPQELIRYKYATNSTPGLRKLMRRSQFDREELRVEVQKIIDREEELKNV